MREAVSSTGGAEGSGVEKVNELRSGLVGRKKGAGLGLSTGSVGLFLSFIMSSLDRVYQWDLDSPDSPSSSLSKNRCVGNIIVRINSAIQ